MSADGEPVTTQIAPTDVDQILDNPLENAMTFAPGTTRLQVRTAERYRGNAAPPGGSCFGLAIASDTPRRWGGALSVQTAECGGARAEVRLPDASTTAGRRPDDREGV